jgi:hypothetical protein
MTGVPDGSGAGAEPLLVGVVVSFGATVPPDVEVVSLDPVEVVSLDAEVVSLDVEVVPPDVVGAV